MIAIDILAWWYSQGWIQVLHVARQRLVSVSQLFSVPILIRTLFSPWKQIISYPGAGIDAQFRALADNFISRLVGFAVRSMVLLAAGILLSAAALFGLLQVLLW